MASLSVNTDLFAMAVDTKILKAKNIAVLFMVWHFSDCVGTVALWLSIPSEGYDKSSSKICFMANCESPSHIGSHLYLPHLGIIWVTCAFRGKIMPFGKNTTLAGFFDVIFFQQGLVSDSSWKHEFCRISSFWPW